MFSSVVVNSVFLLTNCTKL